MASRIEYTLAGSLTALAIICALNSNGSTKQDDVKGTIGRANVTEQFAYVKAGVVSPVCREGATGNEYRAVPKVIAHSAPLFCTP
jgi:hypothetical protein